MADFTDENEGVLFQAAEFGRTDILQSVIGSIRSNDGNALSAEEVGQRISVTRMDDDVSPLHVASVFGHADAVRALLNGGANPMCKPTRGRFRGFTPYQMSQGNVASSYHVYLFEQIALGNLQTIDALLSSGISVHITDGSTTEDSPLHWACCFNKQNVAALLIDHGADVNVQNKAKQTPLHMVCKLANPPEADDLVQLLLQEGADASQVDADGKTCKDYVKASHKNVLNVLNDGNILPLMTHTNVYMERQRALEESEEAAVDVGSIDLSASSLSRISTSAATASFSTGTSKDISPKASAATKSAVTHGFKEEATNKDTDSVKSNNMGSGNSENGDEYGDDEEGDDASIMEDELGDGEDNSLPQLVLWPPAQRQKRHDKPPLVISNDEPLLISFNGGDCSVDISSMLTVSGLVDIFDQTKFNVHIKKTTSGAQIRLCINPCICPGRHKYMVNITADYVEVMSSDAAGLLYGLYTLVQLIQLHSDRTAGSGKHAASSSINKNAVASNGIAGVTANHGRSNKDGSVDAGRVDIILPTLDIVDWPDVPNRAIIWSYRASVQCTPAALSDMLEMFSKTKMNQLYLVVDAVALHEGSEEDGTDFHGATSSGAAKICALEALCKKYFIDMIPMILINNTTEDLPQEILRNFSSKLVSLVFMYDDNSITKKSTRASEAAIQASLSAYKDHCKLMIQNSRVAGFSTIMVSASKWSAKYIRPEMVARVGTPFSGGVIEQDFDYLFPSALCVKPLVGSMQSYTACLSYHAMRAYDNGHSTIFLSILFEREFIFPLVLLKFISMIYGGIVWNRMCVIDMLGPDLTDMPLLQKVACWLVFVTQWQVAPEEIKVFLDSLTASGGTKIIAPAPQSTTSAAALSAGTPVKSTSFSSLLSMATGTSGFDTPINSSSNLSATAEKSKSPGFSTSSFVSSNNLQSMGSAANIAATSTSASATGSATAAANYIPSSIDLAYAENVLVGLMMADVSICNFQPPNKADTGYCLKFSKRILNAAKWKMNTSAPKSFFEFVTGTNNGTSSGTNVSGGGVQRKNDSRNGGSIRNMKYAYDYSINGKSERDSLNSASLDEYYSLLHLFSILCRALIMAYNAAEKVSASHVNANSIKVLLDCLPPGTKSDIANAFLEGLEYGMHIWHKHIAHTNFCAIDFHHFPTSLSQPTAATGSNEPPKKLKQKGAADVLEYTRTCYFSNKTQVAIDPSVRYAPTLPCIGVFYAISENLPIAKSVEDALVRIMNDHSMRNVVDRRPSTI